MKVTRNLCDLEKLVIFGFRDKKLVKSKVLDQK